MDTNNQAIHDTTYGPLRDVSFVTTTTRPGVIHLHLLDWPANGQIVLEDLDSVSSISLLATGEQLAFSQLGGKLVIEVPRQAPDPVITILVIRTT